MLISWYQNKRPGLKNKERNCRLVVTFTMDKNKNQKPKHIPEPKNQQDEIVYIHGQLDKKTL